MVSQCELLFFRERGRLMFLPCSFTPQFSLTVTFVFWSEALRQMTALESLVLCSIVALTVFKARVLGTLYTERQYALAS